MALTQTAAQQAATIATATSNTRQAQINAQTLDGADRGRYLQEAEFEESKRRQAQESKTVG